MRNLTRFTVAAVALGLSATAALARPAVSETDLNVRAGPGTGYQVVGALRQGEPVDVGACSGSWCQVSFGGGRGWANASYLQFGDGSAGYAPPPAVVYQEPYDDDDYAAPAVGFGYVTPGYRYRARPAQQYWREHNEWRGRPQWQGDRNGWGGGNGGGYGRGERLYAPGAPGVAGRLTVTPNGRIRDNPPRNAPQPQGDPQ